MDIYVLTLPPAKEFQLEPNALLAAALLSPPVQPLQLSLPLFLWPEWIQVCQYDWTADLVPV